MKDVLENEVNVGDEVMFIPNHYKELRKGTITVISKARVKISCGTATYIKSSRQFMKVINPEGSLNVYYIKTSDSFTTRVAAKDLSAAIELVNRIRGTAYSVVGTASDGTIHYKL